MDPSPYRDTSTVTLYRNPLLNQFKILYLTDILFSDELEWIQVWENELRA